MTDEETIIGINTSVLKDVKEQVVKCAVENNSILCKIDYIIENSRSYFKCPAGDKFREKYETISHEKQKINDNILSYNIDLSSATDTFEQKFKEVSNLLDNK